MPGFVTTRAWELVAFLPTKREAEAAGRLEVKGENYEFKVEKAGPGEYALLIRLAAKGTRGKQVK